MTIRKELPDFDLVRPVGFCVSSRLRRHEFQDAELLDFFRLERIIFSDGRLTDFLEDDQREDVATIDPFRVPVDDVFSRIGDGISALLGFLVPIYQCAGTTDVDDLRYQFFREGRQRRAKHVGIFHKFGKRIRHAAGFRKFEVWITTEDQTDEAVGGAGGSVEEGSAIFVGEIFFVVLTVETWKIFFGSRFDGIFTGEDIARPLPGEDVCVVIRMCRIDGHERTLARVFENKFTWQNH